MVTSTNQQTGRHSRHNNDNKHNYTTILKAHNTYKSIFDDLDPDDPSMIPR